MTRPLSTQLRRLSQSIPSWPPFCSKEQREEPVADGSSLSDDPTSSQQMSQEQRNLDDDAGATIEATIQDLIGEPDPPGSQAVAQAPGRSTVQRIPLGERRASSDDDSSLQEPPEIPTIVVIPPRSNAQERQSRVSVAQEAKDKPHKQPPRPVIIERKGLLTIVVGASHSSGPASLVVSLDLARRISRLLAWTINQHAQTSRFTHKTLHLPNDNPKMLEQVMRIAHFEFDKVLEVITFAELIDLALLSGRYGLNAFLMQNLPGWIEPHRKMLVREGYEEWMFIAYQFGREADYRRLARHLAMVCTIDDAGNLLSPGAGIKIEGAFPPGSLETIKRARLTTIRSIFRIVYSHIYSLTSSDQCEAHLDATLFSDEDARRERSTCTFINQGMLRRTLDEICFYPRLPDDESTQTAQTSQSAQNGRVGQNSQNGQVQASQNANPQVGQKKRVCKDSVNFLLGQLKSMEPFVARFTVDGKVNLPRDRHAGCDTGRRLLNQVVSYVEQVEDPVTEAAIRELRNNGSFLKKA